MSPLSDGYAFLESILGPSAFLTIVFIILQSFAKTHWHIDLESNSGGGPHPKKQGSLPTGHITAFIIILGEANTSYEYENLIEFTRYLYKLTFPFIRIEVVSHSFGQTDLSYLYTRSFQSKLY